MSSSNNAQPKTKFQKALYHWRRVTGIVRTGIAQLIIPKTVYLQAVPDRVTMLDEYKEFYGDRRRFVLHQHHSRDIVRWFFLNYLLDEVRELPEGDYAELGTFQGTTARLFYKRLAEGARLYCFDTFEGFASMDLDAELSATGVESKVGHFSNTSIAAVQERITGSSSQAENLKLVKGFFPDTFVGFDEHKFRFVHLDADLYAPMKAGLEEFWPKLVPGGVMICHDVGGAYVGSKKAVDEFFGPLGLKPIMMPDKVGSVVIRKPL